MKQIVEVLGEVNPRRFYADMRHLYVGPLKVEWGWYGKNAWRLLWLELLVYYGHGSLCVFGVEILKFCFGVYLDLPERK